MGLETRLLEDAVFRAFLQILSGMRHCDAAGPDGMLELMVGTSDGHQHPAVLLQDLYEHPTVHTIILHTGYTTFKD